MRNVIKLIFLNEHGRISWTAVASIASIILFVHTYIDIWWIGKQYNTSLLDFALQIILVGLGVRGAQRGLQYLGEGVAGISRKVTAQPAKTSEPKQTTPTPQTKQKKRPRVPSGNFSLTEFNSKDGAAMPPDVQTNIVRLIQNLEVIRETLGGLPMTIISGYRSPAHNKKVGGKPNSYHMKGMAADIRVKGISTRKLHDTIEALMDSGQIQHGGLGYYGKSRFVHYDIRNTKIKWNG